MTKLAVKVLSQMINNSFAERCWSTYSFIHNVKRNCLNENWAKNLVYVHYNLRLLTHYSDWARYDRSYVTWDNNPEEENLDNGALHLEQLEVGLLKDENEAATTALTTIPPPSTTSSARVAPSLPPSPSATSRGSHAPFGFGRGRPTMWEETPNKPREKKLEISHGKRKM